jgi:thioredoxin-dependent peroxiredoxin
MVMSLLGKIAPDFTLGADDGSTFSLSDRRGQRLLLVFYPGDDTPVCTAQLCDYRDGIEAFAGIGVEVIGISGDDAESHRRFRAKHDLPFVLLSDLRGTVAKQYGAWGLMGMKRAVYLIDGDGVVRYEKVEAVALFRRTSEELIEVCRELSERE